MTKVAALEYGKHNIRVNSVAPGAVDTPMLRGVIEQFGLDPVERNRSSIALASI